MIFHDIVKNLLVLVDFSDASIFIVKKAAELAQELSARIVLLHIVEPRVVPPPVRDTKSLSLSPPLGLCKPIKAAPF